jgi:iron-sulfur cluster assembly protein
MITLTEKAVTEVKKVMADQEISLTEHALALKVRGGGCSGFQYHMEFVKKTDIDSLNDQVFNYGELAVTVDARSDLYLNGTEVDFKDEINHRGFKFSNPNSKGCCGCGSSFNA